MVLTASDATQYSFEGNQIIGQGTRSVFTNFLVEGLATGEADLDRDGDISLDELYRYVYDRVTEEMPQQRPKKQENVEGRIVIARNIHWRLPVNDTIAKSSQLEREARDYQYTQTAAATDKQTPQPARREAEEQTPRKADKWTAPSWLLGLGRLARHQMVLAAATLVIISLVVVLVVVSTRSITPAATIPVGTGPWGVAVTSDGRHAYVTNSSSNNVSVIDTASNTVTATIPLGTNPRGVAMTPDGRHAYITNYGSNNVSVIEIGAG
jgi:YVTN family beta-propeller protein